VVAPAGKHQQRLGERIHGFAQQQRAQLFGQRGAARFTCDGDAAPGAAQGGRQCLDVRGLARAIDALEGDEQTWGHFFCSW
jgi:hypothetical protein